MKTLHLVRYLVRSVALAAVLAVGLPAGSADDPRERAERLATQAENILTGWSGQDDVIVEARKLIAEALKLDPKSGHAMVELGRSVLMEDVRYDGVSPDVGRAAGELFARAAQLDP